MVREKCSNPLESEKMNLNYLTLKQQEVIFIDGKRGLVTGMNDDFYQRILVIDRKINE